jgi:RNA ligase (TIGR02306 family)
MFDAEATATPEVAFEEPASERRLATIRRIAALEPIEGADRIEIAVVDGWRVIAKKGEYQVGDLAIYLEIDSWVPHTVAPFLTKPGHTPREYKGVEGQRLKSMKMRGELSQGLLLPVSVALAAGAPTFLLEDDDVTYPLGILKWEKDIPAQLRGRVKGNFPAEIHKTDQERVQNAKRILQKEDSWEVTIKLDGSSMTCYVDADDQFWVCSRNLQLIETEDNAFWATARKQDLEAVVRQMNELYGSRVAIQGELMGPGIQGNQEGLSETAFFLFDVFDIQAGKYLLHPARWSLTEATGVNHVPVVTEYQSTPSVEEALRIAEGPSLNPKVNREGVVFKSMTRPNVSFKAVSNTWLLAKGE